MFKKITLFFILTFLVVTLSACSSKQSSSTDTSSKIQVLVSFNAMKEFTKAVGKDKVEIKTIVPNGTEPHDFEPTVKDFMRLSNAKVFIYNGFGMEAWVSKALTSIDNKNLIVVNASKGSTPIPTSNSESKNGGQDDPHLWLSLKGAENEAKNIKDALIKAAPADKDYFEKNYLDYYNQLEQLYDDYNTKFSNCSNKNFVTGHAAFAYLCKDFGLKQNSVEDVFAEGEPSAKKLKQLVDYCKDNKIKTIFVEDMVSPEVSETLAKEVGAKTETIYTMASKEDNKDYLQCMKENLEKIYSSLK